MAQGYTGYNIIDNEITIKDSPNLDAFSRLRVSNPLTIFSNQFTYDASPLIFEQYTNNIGPCQAIHDGTNRSMTLQMGGASAADYLYLQSYEYIPYQPGRSQLVFITFNMTLTGSLTPDVNRYVGLGDDNNGFFLKYDGASGKFEFIIRSTTSIGPQIVPEGSWNLDKMNGTGPSGVAMDWKSTQILVIDFQALYVGRVRMGFDVDGQIIYAHEFLNANTFTYPYVATANLPIRVGLEAVNNTGLEEMSFVCCSVASEGGSEDAQRFGYNFTLDGNVLSLASGPTLNYITSLRPTATFAGYVNRVKFVLDSIDIINTGNRSAYFQLGIGATIITPSYTSVNSNYSAMEYDVFGTSTVDPTLVFNSGYVASGGGVRTVSVSETIQSKYPITLDAAGAPRDLGTIFLYGYGIGGTTDLYYTLKWKEIR